MKFRTCLLGAVLAMLTSAVWAQPDNTFDQAQLVVVDQKIDEVGLLGFGRGGSLNAPEALSRSSPAPTFAALANVAEERVEFYDLWRVQVRADVAPGIYVFSNVEINAIGTLLFDVVVFNSIDAAGDLQTTKFVVADDGMTAVGSGIFTVRSSCPISSCIYIQVFGTQAVGQMLTDGYGDPEGISLIATPIPEPATWAVLALGLAVVGSVVRRRARA